MSDDVKILYGRDTVELKGPGRHEWTRAKKTCYLRDWV